MEGSRKGTRIQGNVAIRHKILSFSLSLGVGSVSAVGAAADTPSKSAFIAVHLNRVCCSLDAGVVGYGYGYGYGDGDGDCDGEDE